MRPLRPSATPDPFRAHLVCRVRILKGAGGRGLARGMEARRAETLGSVHDSPVGGEAVDAPKPVRNIKSKSDCVISNDKCWRPCKGWVGGQSVSQARREAAVSGNEASASSKSSLGAGVRVVDQSLGRNPPENSTLADWRTYLSALVSASAGGARVYRLGCRIECRECRRFI